MHWLQTALGFSITNPTGYTSNFLGDVSVLAAGTNTSRVADVLLTDSYFAFTASQRASLVTFVQQLGGGLVLGGQAW